MQPYYPLPQLQAPERNRMHMHCTSVASGSACARCWLPVASRSGEVKGHIGVILTVCIACCLPNEWAYYLAMLK